MSTEQRDLLNVLEVARKKGARGVELLVETGTGHDIEIHRARVKHNRTVSFSRVTLRCWLEGGKFAEQTNESDGSSVQVALGMLDKTLKKAQKAKINPHYGPTHRLSATSRGLSLEDRRYAGLTTEDRIDVVMAAERGAKGVDPRIVTGPFGYKDWHISRTLLNSKGEQLSEVGTTYGCNGGLRLDAPGCKLQLNRRVDGRTFASISSLPYGTTLAARAVALTGEAVPVKGPVRVLLPPLVTAELFAKIATAFSAKTIQSKGNFLSGITVDSRLHLLDDGSLHGALRTTGFDSRGVSPVPLTLLREGNVHGRFLSPAEARALETRPTGHQRNDGVRPRNLILRPGNRSMNAIMSSLDCTVFVVDHFTSLDGLDLATGDFTVRAFGTVKRGTKAVGPARNVKLKGSLVEAFQNIVEVASDTDRHGHVDAPGLMFDGLIAS